MTTIPLRVIFILIVNKSRAIIKKKYESSQYSCFSFYSTSWIYVYVASWL